MKLSFEQLKSMVVFTHVVDQGSFSAAAKQLELSRTVVSYHIKKLETNLGVTLINRSTRSLSLTDAGIEFYSSCRLISDQAQFANQKMENYKNEPEGVLKITCPVNMGLQVIVPALNVFKAQFPKIELDLILSDEVVNIIQEGIDLAIRGAALPDSGLKARKLSSLPTCLCASPSYLTRCGKPLTPAELEQHNWVMYKLGSPTLDLTKGTRSYRIKMSGDITTNNAAARTAFVEGGHGLGRIPVYDAMPKIKEGTLQTVLDEYELADIEVYGVYPPGATDSKKVRLLLDFLIQYFDSTHPRSSMLLG
ncbi:transcriptional regulator [Aliivibrio sp. 1S165]|uniref:LysR family transcriptional regulator n=1 Tax=unclassified Aliivibrio TaxID=2645654 RepID=UPI00080EB73D|nr:MULTISPECIES: LysR family transcriptional regulator [unclassified Aliivibrio]OCH16731.1 transcriptional regulator [Aliivibrio sp. 1S165]OCH32817.1 transcriptional regulator [Aliivibrio sp. 1S175]